MDDLKMKRSADETCRSDHSIACFISPHGFGHAARACGVMAAIHERDPSLQFEIFTTIPIWFFEGSLSGPFKYHRQKTDIGLIQRSPFEEDLNETLARLSALFPLDDFLISNLGIQIKGTNCELVICDISPMGIAVARDAGVPSVLIENFTWDWIYEGYLRDEPRFRRYAAYLKDLFDSADYHIQTEPVCDLRTNDLIARPISRKVRTPAGEIRGKLGLSDGERVVLITLGGIQDRFSFLKPLKSRKELKFIVPGACEAVELHDNLILLPHSSPFFHPDLTDASNAVVGKAGYSTIAEVFHAGIPFGYVGRDRFRESEILARFIQEKMYGLPIETEEFITGRWLEHLDGLLAFPRVEREGQNGADQVADFILNLLDARGGEPGNSG